MKNGGLYKRSGSAPFLQADGGGDRDGEREREEKGLGFYIIDNPLGKRGPPRFACEAKMALPGMRTGNFDWWFKIELWAEVRSMLL